MPFDQGFRLAGEGESNPRVSFSGEFVVVEPLRMAEKDDFGHVLWLFGHQLHSAELGEAGAAEALLSL
jgi:hypothetical protein